MQTAQAQEVSIQASPSSSSLSLAFLFDRIARRLFDVSGSFIGLLLLSPFFLIISIAIKRDSPGPVFYRGPRVGKDGKPFGILKFRTMYERPESYQGPRVTGAGDLRITPLGQWLRDTKLNELPQLWNVLVGEMSLVGPRPEDPEIAKEWPDQLRKELLSVCPGITSPATVVFRGEEQMLNASNVMQDYLSTILPDKLRLDSIYVRNRNFLTDLDVIFMTLVLLLPRIRMSNVPVTTLYWGPLSQFVSRILNWFLGDTLVAMGAIGIAGLIWRADAPLNIGFQLSIAMGLFVSICFSVFNVFLRLNQIEWSRAPASDVFPLTLSTALSTLILIIMDIVFLKAGNPYVVSPHLPLGMIIVAGLLSFFGFVVLRFRERLLTGFATYWLRVRGAKSAMGERILIVGAGRNSQLAIWLLTHSELSRAFSIIGIVDDDPRKQGMRFDGYRVLGTTEDIPDLVKKLDVGIVFYTITNITEEECTRILEGCLSTGAHLVALTDFMVNLRSHFRRVERVDSRPIPKFHGFTGD